MLVYHSRHKGYQEFICWWNLGEKQTVFQWLVVYEDPSLPDDLLRAMGVKNAICTVVED